MDVRQLKAFVAVFEERNITVAAQRLCLSQPTLSVTIRQLEHTLDTVLFERQARGVAVTDDARLLYPQARRLLDQADGIVSRFRERNSGLPLELGLESDLGPGQIEGFLRLARQVTPALRLMVRDGCVGDARLAAEEARCEDELFLPLWEESFVLALPAGHPLAQQDMPGMEALERAGWITCPSHASHQRLLALHGAGNGNGAQAGSLTLALHMVAAGLGVALLPQALLHGRTDVVSRPLAGPLPTRRVGLCYAAQALELAGLRALHDYLLNVTAAGRG